MADGNVVYPDFRKKPSLPEMTFECETLYADDYVLLVRLTYRVNGRLFMQHIASGVGLDA